MSLSRGQKRRHKTKKRYQRKENDKAKIERVVARKLALGVPDDGFKRIRVGNRVVLTSRKLIIALGEVIAGQQQLIADQKVRKEAQRQRDAKSAGWIPPSMMGYSPFAPRPDVVATLDDAELPQSRVGPTYEKDGNVYRVLFGEEVVGWVRKGKANSWELSTDGETWTRGGRTRGAAAEALR